MNTTERQQWLDNRKKCVTGTDIGAILGLSPWKTEFEVWLDKTSTEQREQADNAAMSVGRYLEPAIARMYADRNAVALDKGAFVYREIAGVPCGGTPDYLLVGAEIGLEIKTSRSAQGWGDSGSDEIPLNYLAQCCWYMGLLGFKAWHLAVLIGAHDYRQYTIEQNEELWTSMLEAARDFWRKVQVKEPPEVDGSDGARSWIRQQFRGGKEVIAEPSPELLNAAQQLKYYSEEKARTAEAYDTWLNRTLTLMGDHDKARFDFGTISIVRPKDRVTTAWETIAGTMAPSGVPQELIEAHTTTKPSNPYLKTAWNKE